MADETANKPKLPGNQGQFGEGDATEAYAPLENQPTPPQQPTAPAAPKQTNAGERS